ncbi:IMPACT family protein [Cumulibacter soli]|uniref:IMPACT family protein n=1 Tax=Cumulibacter soli TaxID=2546344 RepID=UPI0010675562|nr:YigZ family protein [Cumulibacter soli]
MVEEYRTVAKDADAEIEVKRSRFLARIRRVGDEGAARAVIEGCRKQYWDARHHCSAFVLGPAGEISRSNDDGEPSGTAGAPILGAVTGRELSDVVVVVTRYFGGTLLGAGGLVRAYTDATLAGLDTAGVRRRRRAVRVEVTVPIADVGRVENAMRSIGLDVAGADYAADAIIRGALAPDLLGEANGVLASLTKGAGLIDETGSSWVDT